VGDVVSLPAARALRELAALVDRRPDIGAAVQAAAAAEGGSMGGLDLEFLTVNDAAERLRVQPMTIRAWIRQGRLPAFRAGRRVLVRPAALAALVEPLALAEAEQVAGPLAELLHRLKVWRDERAMRDQAPAGTAIPDPVLERIARRRPTTATELRIVPGMGAVRAGKYGEDLLAIVSSAAG
jgi:excisionase family DNA binding protein